MQIHPFKPQISKTTRKLLIGTLPPEDVIFYFSNSSNTRLWDILTAINENTNYIGSGGNSLSYKQKIEILEKLKIGISDIIYGYERDQYHSTKDSHIKPKKYNDLLQLALDNNIHELLFVYQSALKWFVHSLGKTEPIRLNKIKTKYNIGRQQEIQVQGKTIKCTLLPSPLNRGRKGETLDFKLAFYRKYILEE
jgi:G:T/U-mismatch repair DNA glycosylase